LTLALVSQLEAELDLARATGARFRHALESIGIDAAGIACIEADEEIGSDYLAAADFSALDALNRATEAEAKSTRLEAALTELRDDYTKLERHFRRACEILNAYAPRSVVGLGHD
jgi:hypothetical protein